MNKINIQNLEFEEFLSEKEIYNRISELADEINEKIESKHPLFIPILNGSFMFAADLVRKIKQQPEFHFIKISTYEGISSTGNAKHIEGFDMNAKGREIFLIEDIVDTGFTLDYLISEIQKLEPLSITVVTLLFKEDAFKGKTKPDFIGFNIPNKFVVGYGMDYNQKGRELKSIFQVLET